MLFGLNLSPSSEGDPVGAARRAEELGFDFVSVNDHLHGSEPRNETWTMLAWIAAATSRIQVASRVLAVPYRPPPVLAKMAETFDRLSDGRLILGLGGGYSDEEFRAFGLGEWSPKDKVEGLEEAVRIIRGLWSGRRFTFDGRMYRTANAEVEPKPNRRIPIWLGTYGPRALAVTGRVADGWIPTLELAPPERIVPMRDTVVRAAQAGGRDPDEITCVYNIDVRVGDARGTSSSVVSGSPGAVAEQLLSFRALGFDAVNLCPVGADEQGQAEILAREVIPALRAVM